MTWAGGRLVAGLACAAIAGVPAPAARPVTVRLLAINDLHGHLEPPAGKDGTAAGKPAGGIAYLATHLRRAGLGRRDTMLVGAGDMIGGSPFLSAYFDHVPTIAALNALPLGVTAIGNHELDDGAADFARRLAGACKAETPCVRPAYVYLAANLLIDGAPLLPASTIRTIDGVRIGFIGATLADTAHMLTPSAVKGLTVLDPADSANAAAARLEADGVHAIVLLLHEGGRQHPPGAAPATANGCANFSGDVTATLARLSPAIRIVLSGHTHAPYVCHIGGRLVTSADAFGRMFTRVSLRIDPATDRVIGMRATNLITTRDVPPDPAESAIVANYAPQAARVTDRVIGTAVAPIPRTDNDAGESALGDVLADAALESAPADIAFVNSGGIRSDLVPGADGRVSYGALYAIQPFGNRLMTVTLTGDALRQLLEQQFTIHASSPDILQISAGFGYRYRRDAPAGQHIVPGTIRLNGRVIAPDQTVRVRISDFLLSGGDGFTMFGQATDIAPGPRDLEALIAYAARHTPIVAGGQDRVLRVDRPAAKQDR